MADEQGLPRPTLAAWAVYAHNGVEVRVPKYVPSAATNNKAIQDDDVPKGAVWLRDEPLEVPAVGGDADARLAAAAAALRALDDITAPVIPADVLDVLVDVRTALES